MENTHNAPTQQTPPVFTPGIVKPRTGAFSAPLNTDTIKSFFRVTGGSSLYCLSAVLVAYGIIRVLAPVLEGSDTIRDAIPALLTLHIYELALLGVLLLLVFRKVVDDAVSLAILIILFLVGTSIAFGSVADRAPTASLYLGLAGVLLAFIKIAALRRIARIPLNLVSLLGFVALMAYNYLGPVLMARGVAAHPSDEALRRQFWLWIYLFMLGAAVVVWMQTIRTKSDASNRSFFHSPLMACLLAVLLVACCGVHQYTMAYAFTLQRVLLDYVPVVAMVCLLLMELFRFSGRQFASTQILLAFVPLAMTLYAIYHKSVLSGGEFGVGLIAYPPFMLALVGLAVAGLAFHQRRKLLWIPAYAYLLGVILTAGFSPLYPHQLNMFSFGAILILSLVIFGLLCWNPYICLAGVIIAGGAMPMAERFAGVMKDWQLTEFGGVLGVLGIGGILLYLIFTDALHKYLRIAAALCLAAFMFDYLPMSMSWRYAVVVISIVLLSLLLWYRTRDAAVIAILTLPLWARGYMLAKLLAYWRHVILGFLLLAGGAAISLFKRPRTDEALLTNPADVPESMA